MYFLPFDVISKSYIPVLNLISFISTFFNVVSFHPSLLIEFEKTILITSLNEFIGTSITTVLVSLFSFTVLFNSLCPFTFISLTFPKSDASVKVNSAIIFPSFTINLLLDSLFSEFSVTIRS